MPGEDDHDARLWTALPLQRDDHRRQRFGLVVSVRVVQEEPRERRRNKGIPPLPLPAMGVSDPALGAYVEPRLAPQPVLTFLQGSKALPQRPDVPPTYVLAATGGRVFPQFYEVFKKDPRARALILQTGHAMMLTDPAGRSTCSRVRT